MKKLNITYDAAEIENGEKIVGETCYIVDFADDRVADRLLDHGTSGVAVAELEKLLRVVERFKGRNHPAASRARSWEPPTERRCEP